MDRKWVAALAAVSGIGLVTLAGCDGSAEAETAASMAEQVLMDRIAIEDMVTRYYANFGKQDSADDFGAFYTEDAVFDANPWYEAIMGVLMGGAGLCLLMEAVRRPARSGRAVVPSPAA